MIRGFVCCAALAIVASLQTANAEEGLFVAVGIGGADVDYDGPLFASDDPVEFDSSSSLLAGEILVGYEFANDLFVEIGERGYASFNLGLGDQISLSAIRTGLGYSWSSESRLGIVTKAGLAFWDLRARESFLFNPGPEEQTRQQGTDLFLEAGVEFRFTDAFRMGLSWEYVAVDFGGASSVMATFKFVP
ncbi:MAG: outer membrane beta-barrel protein [Pseudomonadota bacterium]